MGREVTTFVYPYGTYDKDATARVKKAYTYVMRIGNAVNISWKNPTGVIYRINADGMDDPYELFSWVNMLKYRWKLFANLIRKK